MPAGGKPVLTSSHKLLGNMIPLAVMVAVAMLGALMVFRSRTDMIGWFLLLVSPLLGWLSVNMVGLWGNRQLRSEVEFRLKILRPRLQLNFADAGREGARRDHPARRSGDQGREPGGPADARARDGRRNIRFRP